MRVAIGLVLVVGCASSHWAPAPLAQPYDPAEDNPAPVVEAPATQTWHVVPTPPPAPAIPCSSSAPNITVVTRNETKVDPDLCTPAVGAVAKLPASILGQTFDIELTLSHAYVGDVQTWCAATIALRSGGVSLGESSGDFMSPGTDNCIDTLVEQLVTQGVPTALNGPWKPPAFRSYQPIPSPAPPALKPTTLDPTTSP